MILFHYYIYFKSLREIDRIDLSASVVHLACKLNYSYIKYEEMLELVEILKKRKRTMELKMGNYELDLLLFLGFDCNFILPYEYLYTFSEKFKIEKSANKIIKIIINESFRRPICIFFHPRTICIAAIFFYENFLFEKNISLIESDNKFSNLRFKTMKDFSFSGKIKNQNLSLNLNENGQRTKIDFLVDENNQIKEEFDACYKMLQDILVNLNIKNK